MTDSRTLPDIPNKPGVKNWVERAGGLPSFIRRIAKHLVAERGYTTSHAIATAVNQCRKVCATGRTFGGRTSVSAPARARYCKAAAEWEAKKVRAHVQDAQEPSIFDLDSLAEEAWSRLHAIDAGLGEAAFDELVTEAALSSAARGNLPASAFVFPKDKRYPIHDRAHAANALARSAGKPEESTVRSAVCSRYKDLPACQKNGKVQEADHDAAELRAFLEEEALDCLAIVEAVHKPRHRDGKYTNVLKRIKGKAAMADGEKVQEGVDFEKLHPRGRGGQWIKKLASMAQGSSTTIEGVKVDRQKNGDFIVHHPPGSPRSKASSNPRTPTPDPNLAGPKVAADSLEGAVKHNATERYLGEKVNYGGQEVTRAEVIKDLRAQGASQRRIDRYLQGADRAKSIKPKGDGVLGASRPSLAPKAGVGGGVGGKDRAEVLKRATEVENSLPLDNLKQGRAWRKLVSTDEPLTPKELGVTPDDLDSMRRVANKHGLEIDVTVRKGGVVANVVKLKGDDKSAGRPRASGDAPEVALTPAGAQYQRDRDGARLRKRKPKRKLNTAEQHQLKAARDTLKMSDSGAKIMGGPDKAEARRIIKRLTEAEQQGILGASLEG